MASSRRKAAVEMIKQPLLVLLLLLVPLAACANVNSKGSFAGVVVREGTNEVVPKPVLFLTPISGPHASESIMVRGDHLGRFEVVLLEGHYTARVGPGTDGPFVTWPDRVPILPGVTTIWLFTIPEDM